LEVLVEDVLHHVGKGEVRHGAADVAADVAVLQAPNEDGVHARAGDHAELPGEGDRLREHPVGHADPHAALDDERVLEPECGHAVAGKQVTEDGEPEILKSTPKVPTWQALSKSADWALNAAQCTMGYRRPGAGVPDGGARVRRCGVRKG